MACSQLRASKCLNDAKTNSQATHIFSVLITHVRMRQNRFCIIKFISQLSSQHRALSSLPFQFNFKSRDSLHTDDYDDLQRQDYFLYVRQLLFKRIKTAADTNQ
jgi:hypothetical protein